MDKISFTARLARERRRRGYTQKQIAEALGVSNRTYSKWETGENEMDVSTLCRLSALYSLSPAAFFAEGESQPLLKQELSSLPLSEAARRCHAWMDELYAGLWESDRLHLGAEGPVTPPPAPEIAGTSRAEYPGGALFLRHRGRDANLHLLLMPAEEGFGWLHTEAEALSAFFSLLRNPRLLEPLLDMETGGRQDFFTREHLARQAGLSPEEAGETLEALERLKLCRRVDTETAEGGMPLYTGGETRLLRAILTLAHLEVSSDESEGGDEA